jgi:hypothetical protein
MGACETNRGAAAGTNEGVVVVAAVPEESIAGEADTTTGFSSDGGSDSRGT